MPIIAKQESEDNPSGALILYKNLLVSSVRLAPLTPHTYNRAVTTSTSKNDTYQLASAEEIDTVAIAGHNFGAKNATVTISIAPTVAGTFTVVGSMSPSDNKAIMFNFEKTVVADVKIRWETPVNTTIEYAVMYAGLSLQMPTNIYGGHSPITLSQKTEYQAVKSESGQILGKTIIRKGLETQFNWQFLDDQFYRDEFQTFVESARTLPFFIKWRPDFYSDEVAYGEVNQDIQPVNMGSGHRLMSVGFTMTAHADL